MRLEVVPEGIVSRLLSLGVRPTLFERILESQKTDTQLQLTRDKFPSDQESDFSVGTTTPSGSRDAFACLTCLI